MKKVVAIILASLVLITSMFIILKPKRAPVKVLHHPTIVDEQRSHESMSYAPQKKAFDWGKLGGGFTGLMSFLVLLSNITGYKLKDIIDMIKKKEIHNV